MKYKRHVDFSAVNKVGNEYSRFEKLHLQGYVAVGDAVINFNPTYGQGMTTVAEGVLLLDTMLREKGYSSTFCNDFQSKLSVKLTIPWMMAVLNDLRFPETEGGDARLRFMLPVVGFFLDLITRKCVTNVYVYRQFLEILHMNEGFVWVLADPRFYYELFFK